MNRPARLLAAAFLLLAVGSPAVAVAAAPTTSPTVPTSTTSSAPSSSAAPTTSAAPTSAPADPGTQAAGFGAPSASRSVFGDFTEVGNGVLRCPVAGETMFLLATPEACRGATQRDPAYRLPLFDWGANNGYYMQLAGTASTTVFDASSATLTIPAGTSVAYAQLDWGGNTGGYQGADQMYCTAPLLQLLKQPAAPPPAPATAQPSSQPVSIAVGADPALTVPLTPDHYTASESAKSPAGMYSDWADVTGELADVTGGAPTTVTVGNVWTPTGYGCAAGWSLTVVYGTPQATPAYPGLRQVDVYAGHQRGDFLDDDELQLAGLSANPAAAHVELGLTAYDGDWNNGSDSLAVDGTRVDDPCGASPGHSDFFTGCAAGALDPLNPGAPIPNNFSVDAKTVTPTITGTSSNVEVELRPGADVLLLQGLTLAEDIHPAFTATATVPDRTLHRGSTLVFTVSGTNTGDVPLADLGITDSDHAVCDPASVAAVPVGGTYSFSCRITDVQQAIDDPVVVSAGWPHDDLGVRAQVTVPLSVPVAGPQLTISQTADPAAIQAGDPVTVTVTVGNAGGPKDGALTNVTVTEPQLSGCTLGPIASLAPDSTQQLSCRINPADAVTAAVGHATATDVTGAQVSATSDPMAISVSKPELTISVEPDSPEVAPGAQTDFTVFVHNTGDVPLDVQVTNSPDTDCDFTATGLAAGTNRSQKCTVHAGAAGTTLSDTASYQATPETTTAAAEPLAGQATGTIKVTTAATGSGAGTGSGGSPLPGDGSAAGSGGTSGSGAGGAAGSGSGTPKKLAWTGVSVVLPAVGGAALLAGGATLLILTRRRRNS